MSAEERQQIKQKFGTDVVEIPVAKDGVAIYVSESNPVDSLSMDQLRTIYSGAVSNWKDVGGSDAKIILYGRENSSGTYSFFKEHVLKKGDFAPATQTLPGTAGVVSAITKDPNGIGYGGEAYSKGVKMLKIVQASGLAVSPTEENIRSGAYPLARDLYFYLRQQPTGAAKQYIDWVLSAEGQAVVKEVGYFPIK
jgi:phosphate transport system substrate-binding protein